MKRAFNWLYNLVEWLLKRKREERYQQGIYFRIANEVKEGLLPIEILKGPYAGTLFTITDVTLLDDHGRCRFERKIITKKSGVHDSYYGPAFDTLVGEFLMVVMEQISPDYKQVEDIEPEDVDSYNDIQ